LKLKSQLSEAADANQSLTTVANELTQEIDHVANELALLKVDMAAKDVDLKKALEENKRVADQMKILTDQMEAVRIAAMEEFKLSEAYDDNNTKYFLVGFELLRKQAKEKYLDLDSDVFQPYENDDSVRLVKEGNNVGTSADPQLDDDATN
jgi:predicted nuclease with TOPRIM domain